MRGVVYEWPDWARTGCGVWSRTRSWRCWVRRAGGLAGATGPGGVQLVAVWARTRRGRPLIVAVRQVGEWDWWIVGARDLTGAEMVAVGGVGGGA